MAKTGFGALRAKQRIQLKGEDDLIINFGKYSGMSIKRIARIDPEYVQFLLDTQWDTSSEEVRKRLKGQASKSLNFWI